MRKHKTKKRVNIILGVLGLLLAVYALIPKGISYKNLGIIAITVFGILAAVNFLVLYRFSGKWIKRIRITLNAVLVVAVVIMAVGTAVIYTAPKSAPNDGEYTVVVLGAKIFGTEPGGVLKNRLDTAAEFLKENADTKCVVTGGQGSDEVCSEASVMKDYLIKAGIEEDRIILEDKSTSTKENIENAYDLVKAAGESENFIICTDPYHQYRAKLFCGELGITSYSLSTPLNFWIEPIYLVREILAVFYYFVL